ncbi:MAG TPA: LCP family protein [Trichocoleus sp.]
MSTNLSDSAPGSAPVTSSHQWRWLWLILGLVGVAGISASAGALLAVAISGTPLLQSKLSLEDAKVFNQKEPITTGMSLRLPQLTRPVNIMVLGIKVLASETEDAPPESRNLSYDPVVNSLNGLADSMLLVRFNPPEHQLVVMSLPRDTRTWVEGGGLTKLNEANVYGGPALAARSVSDLLGGVGIDRYIRINVQGVEKLIDALGGITVNVPQDMYYKDDTQHLYIDLKKGEQHLNGAKAVQFLRFRYDQNGDIGRVQRQQMFMRALIEQALKPSTLGRLPQVLSVIQTNIDTNLSVEELLALAGFAAQTNRPNVQMLMLPGDFSSASEFDLSYWLPNHSKIAQLMQQYFGLTNVDPVVSALSSNATIAVQDSTGEDATVQELLNTLKDKGYANLYVDNPWNEPLATTQIVAQSGDLSSAEAIQQSLGFGEVLVESTGDLQSDVTIRLGQDALQPTQPVAAPTPELQTPKTEPEAERSIPTPAASPTPSFSPIPEAMPVQPSLVPEATPTPIEKPIPKVSPVPLAQ